MAINNAGNLIENLKCIGGPNDGKYAYIGQFDRVGDCVRVEKRQNVKLSPFDLEGHQKAATIQYNEYVIDCFHFSKDDLYYFLRPANWTNKQAVLHQFKK